MRIIIYIIHVAYSNKNQKIYTAKKKKEGGEPPRRESRFIMGYRYGDIHTVSQQIYVASNVYSL